MVSGPIVTLSVDDCWKDQAIRFKEIFETNGLKGVFYVITDFVGRNVGGFEFVDWECVRAISQSGHEIGSHSCTHKGAGLNKLQKTSRLLRQMKNDGITRSTIRAAYTLKATKDEYNVSHLSQENEIKLSKTKIERELGIACNSYSYPGGGYTETLKSLVKSSGYSSARTGLSGFNLPGGLDQYALKVQTWDQTVSIDLANSWVDRALKDNLWLIEVFHTMDLENYMYSCSHDMLEQHLRYIHSHQKEIGNMTMSEVMK